MQYLERLLRWLRGGDSKEPEPILDLEPSREVLRENWLRARERQRVDSPVAYEEMQEYLKNELAHTRKAKMFTCDNPSEFILHMAIYQQVKVAMLESWLMDLDQTVGAETRQPEWHEVDVPPAGLSA